VVGAFYLSRQAGFEQAITLDMGGTSTDVALCPGVVQKTTEAVIGELPLGLPTIDIHTVGAGGGSIARLDKGGALRVGPESAGSDPGPVCYGKPDAFDNTVTDANLILGRLDAEWFLGGRMTLDVERCKERMQALARRLSLPMEAAAWGVVRVANANMERAIRRISVERGYDPRHFTLVAFGGAGPLHACDLASALRIPRVLMPPHPGVLSALGMILADVVKDYSQTVMRPAREATVEVLQDLFAPIFQRAIDELGAEGIEGDQITLLPALDMRYQGQSYELPVSLGMVSARDDGAWPGLADGNEEGYVAAFHAVHRQRFSYSNDREPVEVVNVRLKAVGGTTKPRFSNREPGNLDPKAAHLGYKRVYFAGADSPQAARPVPAALYDRDRLVAGNMIVGPAVIFQLDTTCVIPPGWSASVDGWGNLVAEGAGQ
jgi:N-methylhydantoinase A